MTIQEAEKIAREHLSGHRLEHSLSAARLAVKIGRMLGLPQKDEDALFIAGALHDIAKDFSAERRLELAKLWCAEEGMPPPPPNAALWHAPAAAWLIRREFKVSDARIAYAAARHTTGGCGMTRFDECLYAADYLDLARPHPAQGEVWPLLEQDFDAALLAICRSTIQSVLAKRAFLDPASAEYYNELLARADNVRAFS